VIDAIKTNHTDQLESQKVTMPITAPTILDQITAQKTKLSERLARLDAERAQVATEFTELEAAERVLARFSKTPLPRRPAPAAAGKAKASAKLARREPSPASLAERVLALAPGKTRRELYLACPKDRPNVIGMAVQRHIRAGRIQERDGKLYAASSGQEQPHAAD
jgi:hypothetical protein